jgi:glycosyltransferase involved in cell wall biosynthesis/LmbE family N-acetylglucosaminyl deacetylase
MQTNLIPHEATMSMGSGSVIVLAPHPDDEVFGCGGAIIRHVVGGDRVCVVVVTDGEGRVEPADRAAYGALRRQESRAASQILGYGEPLFWALPDGGVVYDEALVQQIERAILFCSADLIYAPSIHEMHPDHRAVGMAAMEAVRRLGAAAKLAMYEVGVAMMRPNLLLDISELSDQKQRAMACFVSQLKEQAYDQHITALNSFRTYTLGHQVTAAEAYFVTQGEDLSRDVLGLFEPEYRRQSELNPPHILVDVPLVSVVVRSMDRRYLREALDSLALQTYARIEVVVVNAKGGLHQDLGSSCGRFPLRLVGDGSPLQRSSAANLGLDHATGEFIMFLDDDDWLAPHHVWVLADSLQASPSIGVAYTGVELRGGNREILDAKPFNDAFNVARLRSGNYIPINAVMFMRSLAESQCVRFDESLVVYEDWDFLLQLSQGVAFTHVPGVSAYYRTSGTSHVGLLSDATAKRLARAKVFEKWKSHWSGEQFDEIVIAANQLATEALDQTCFKLRSVVEEKTLIVAALERSALTREDAFLQRERTQVAAVAELVSNHAAALLTQAVEKDLLLQIANGRLYDVVTSPGWRWTQPLRWLVGLRPMLKRRLKKFVQRLFGVVKWPMGAPFLSQGFAGEELVKPGENESNPLVSVIMPVYNACRVDKEYFLCALKSIQGQTYKNVELIIVDDGSTDDTKEVYDDFILKHPDFKTKYFSKENGGQSSARNFGVKNCNGSYVGFLDQDDEWYLDKLERVVPWLADQSIDVLYTDSDVIDGDGVVDYKNMHKKHFFGWPHPKFCIEDILFKDIMVMPGLMTVKKNAFERVKGFDENLSGYEDDDLFLRLFESCKMFYLPVATLRWRIYGGNYSFSHRMLTSRTYFWKKLIENHTDNKRDIFRVRMISTRFFQEFVNQSLLQFEAGNDLYKKSLSGAREIIPFLPKLQRLILFIGFLLPEKYLVRFFIRFKKYYQFIQ